MVSTSERRLTNSSLTRAWRATPRFFVNAYTQELARGYSTINWPVIFLWPNLQNTDH
jgi:hypothetical protein